MNKILSLLTVFFMSLSGQLMAQYTITEPDSVSTQNPSKLKSFAFRKNLLLTSNYWNCNSTNRGDHDNGKRYWPLLLAQLYLAKNNPGRISYLIAVEGQSGISSLIEGTTNKPFSGPGLCFYYFTYKNRLPSKQKEVFKNYWNLYNRQYTSRKDGQMDPLYQSTEFNSENFDWMARLSGYLMSHEMQDTTPIEGIKAMTYYKNFANNWVRGTFNCGRVEWESHVYSGFCLQAALTLREFAPTYFARKQAHAVCDWIMLETALRHLDGALVGAESRDKGLGYLPFNGSIWPYAYLYFGNKAIKNVNNSFIRNQYKTDLATSGFIAHTSYRSAEVINQIGERKFKCPLEIQSAKPFYHLDYENYANWQGNTPESRRFEFETLYLDSNYTFSSLATYRPSGHIGTFSEQCLWRLGVKPSNNDTGAFQVFGNTGSFSTSAGRDPLEEIGQYHNVMMRLLKGGTSMWLAIPKKKSASFDGNILFSDLGNGVYLAVIPYNQTGKSSGNYGPDLEYTKYTYSFSSTQLAALVTEIGTKSHYGSFNQFKAAIKNLPNIVANSAINLAYTSGTGLNLQMEYMPTVSYTYMTNFNYTAEAKPAGVVPRIWRDGVENDFNTWDSYKVSYGFPIVEQKWGSGQLTVRSDSLALRITIDPVTAEVRYEKSFSDVLGLSKTEEQALDVSLKIFPNPVLNQLTILSLKDDISSVKAFDLTGKEMMQEIKPLIDQKSIDIETTHWRPGFYVICILRGMTKPVYHKMVKR